MLSTIFLFNSRSTLSCFMRQTGETLQIRTNDLHCGGAATVARTTWQKLTLSYLKVLC
jgi:hypothetical protein